MKTIIQITTDTDENALMGSGSLPENWTEVKSFEIQNYLDRCAEYVARRYPDASIEVYGEAGCDTKITVDILPYGEDTDQDEERIREDCSRILAEAWGDWCQAL